jgi:hypothetical protein
MRLLRRSCPGRHTETLFPFELTVFGLLCRELPVSICDPTPEKFLLLFSMGKLLPERIDGHHEVTIAVKVPDFHGFTKT